MSATQFGVRTSPDHITWCETEVSARRCSDTTGYALVAREIGEPYEVKTRPTTPSSVIKHSNYGFLVLDEDDQWGAYGVALTGYEQPGEDNYGWTWTLVFDAGATS